MPELSAAELRSKINGNPALVKLQLDGYAKWEVCTGCADLYGYKVDSDKTGDMIFLEHPGNESRQCKAAYEDNVPLDKIRNLSLLRKILETLEYCYETSAHLRKKTSESRL